MSAQVPPILAERVRAADRDTCCYCRTTVVNSGMPLSFDLETPTNASHVVAGVSHKKA